MLKDELPDIQAWIRHNRAELLHFANTLREVPLSYPAVAKELNRKYPRPDARPWTANTAQSLIRHQHSVITPEYVDKVIAFLEGKTDSDVLEALNEAFPREKGVKWSAKMLDYLLTFHKKASPVAPTPAVPVVEAPRPKPVIPKPPEIVYKGFLNAEVRPARTCQWVTDEAHLQFCSKTSLPGCSWCAYHHSIVFLPPDLAAGRDFLT